MGIEDLEGAVLADRFVLNNLLGRGGYGAVFEAEQLSMNRRCAVKVLTSRVTGDPKVTKRFEHEARITSKLSHPNTIVIYEFGRDDARDVLFIAMEFIDGTPLDRFIATKGMLSVNESLHIAAQIAASLDDAHELGVVHRDVKPQNIMIVKKGNESQFVKVIDFGLVKIVTGDIPTKTTFVELTKTGVVVGTPAYMSPEQIDSGITDGRSDQYSLAVTVYTMLTGRTPFIGANPIDVATKHILEQPLPPSTFRTNLAVSNDFELALLRALSKDPTDRFSSCGEFIETLAGLADVEGIEQISAGVTLSERPRDQMTTEPTELSDTQTMNLDVNPHAETSDVPSEEISDRLSQEETLQTVKASSAELDQEASATLIAPEIWPEFEESQHVEKRPHNKTNWLIVGLFAVGLCLIATAVFLAWS